jgi:hypothetical protein
MKSRRQDWLSPRWTDIEAAIEHNRRVLNAKPPSMGLSIERETWMLAYVLEKMKTHKQA